MGNVFKVGALTLREHIRDGEPFGRWQVDVPPHLTMSGRRQRLSFRSREEAERGARDLLIEVRMSGAAGSPASSSPVPTLKAMGCTHLST